MLSTNTISIFFTTALTTSFRDQERMIEEQNDITYDIINKLARTDLYSKVKIEFYDKCPRVVDGCKVTSCEVPKISYKDEEGVVDLLKVVESYSPNISHSNLVWRDIYKTTEDEVLLKVLSGLHFSVSTHIAAFHTKMFGGFISNPKKFQNRYKEEYKRNFILLYSLVRSAIGNIKNIKTPANKETLELSYKINVGNLPKIDAEATTVVGKCIECISCLNCEKCILWGTIQSRGLRSCIRALNGRELFKNDLIYMINLFRRLSETVKQSRRMKDVKMPMLRLPFVYYKQFVVFLMVSLTITLILVRRKQNKLKIE